MQSWNGITGTAPDAANNLQYDPATNSQYAWDARNQLATLDDAELTNFLYDALGRVEAAYPLFGLELDYQFDGRTEIGTTTSLEGRTTVYNVLTMPGSGEVLTYSYPNGGSTTTFVPIQDQIGSTVALVDASGNLAGQFSYEPYGKVTESGQTIGYPYLFAGMEQADSYSGLYRTFARYYNPHLQRFLSEDPLGFTAGDTNFFSYAGDNPVSGSDPSGECALGDCAGGGSIDQEGPAPSLDTAQFVVQWIQFFISLFDGGGGGGHPYIRGQGFKAHTINRNTGIPKQIAPRQLDLKGPQLQNPATDMPGGGGITPIVFPFYNYCGSGNHPGNPKGGTDKCCEAHDECYGKNDLSAANVSIYPTGQGAGPAQQKCDQALCNCFKHNAVPSGPYDLTVMGGAMYLFCYQH